MRTLALHTRGSHTARNMTVRPLQTRETADRPALTYTRMSAFQALSIDTRRFSRAPHCAQTAWQTVHTQQTALQYTLRRGRNP